MHTYVPVLVNATETLENGHNIDELISHGIDLLSNLLPESASGDELRSVSAWCLVLGMQFWLCKLLSFIMSLNDMV